MGARWGLKEGLLELSGTAIAERRVTTPAIVEHLDELEQRLLCLRASLVLLVMDQLTLQGAEETLNHCVVIAVTSTTHAGLNMTLLKGASVLLTRVLNSAIAMVQDPF